MRYLRTSLVIMLLACTGHAYAESKIAEELPVESFVQNEFARSVTMSIDGRHVASIRRADNSNLDGEVVEIYNVDEGVRVYFAATDNFLSTIDSLAWLNKETLLLRIRLLGTSNSLTYDEKRLITLDVSTGETKRLIYPALLENKRYQNPDRGTIIDFMYDDPNHILLALALRGKIGEEVIKLDINQSRHEVIQRETKGYYRWVVDQKSRPRVARVRLSKTRSKIVVKDVKTNRFKVLFEYEYFSQDRVIPQGFGRDPNVLYYRAFHNGYWALFKIDVTEKKPAPELVYAVPGRDVIGNIYYEGHYNADVIGMLDLGAREYHFWDPEFKKMQASLDKVFPETFNSFYGLAKNRSRLLILRTSAEESGHYYLWDRVQKTVTPFAVTHPAVLPEEMAPSKLITFESRDGTVIDARLTLPRGSEEQPPGPAVIMPRSDLTGFFHGGFDHLIQMLANRGYSVLQVNQRGANGKRIEDKKSGLANWGRGPQDDIFAATQWLIKEGIADTKKVCIVGRNFGAYAAIMETIINPGTYRCVAALGGVFDLGLEYELTRDIFKKKQLGTGPIQLRKRSPVTMADKVSAPVLLLSGKSVNESSYRHSRLMKAALDKAGKQVELVEYFKPSYRYKVNQGLLTLYSALDEFLKEQLTQN